MANWSHIPTGVGLLFRQNPAALYTLFGQRSGKGYINLGYWDGRQTRLEEASDELVRRLGQLAGLGARDVVLDVGFGYGQQDVLWAREFQVRRILGVNITWLHTREARKRIADEGLTERIYYQQADATALPFRDNSFDKVVALECAFHFNTRADFFAEARRVLKPGGVLATADVVRGNVESGGLARLGHGLFGFLHHRLWQIPGPNRCDVQEYRRLLAAGGLKPEHVEDVTPQVLAPFAAHCLSKDYPDQPSYIQPLLRATRRFLESGYLRYVFSKSRA